MAREELGNRHLAWIGLWSLVGLGVPGLGGFTIAYASPKHGAWWVWAIIAFLAVVLLFSIWAASSIFTHKWPYPKPPESEAHEKWMYDVLIRVGDPLLKALESSLQQASYSGHSQNHMDRLMQFVMRDERACQEWLLNALVEVEGVAGKTGRTLFVSHTVTRQIPSYISDDIGSQIWTQTASRLDWLRAELAKM